MDVQWEPVILLKLTRMFETNMAWHGTNDMKSMKGHKNTQNIEHDSPNQKKTSKDDMNYHVHEK